MGQGHKELNEAQQQDAGSEVEQADHELVPIQDFCIAERRD